MPVTLPDSLACPAKPDILSGAKADAPFPQEMGKMISRPHRLFLLLVMFLLLYAGVKAAQTEPLKVFEMTLDASKWVLGIIGGFGLMKKTKVMEKVKGGALA